MITCEALNCLPPAVTVTSTFTLVSVLLPVSSTVTVKVGLPPPLMWFSVGSGASVFVPTLTLTSELPWVPGATPRLRSRWPAGR